MDWLIDLISNTAFPICMCVAFFKTQNTTIDELKTAVVNNTNTMNKILEKLNDE